MGAGTTTIVEHPGFGPQGCDLPHQPTAYLEQADGRCHTDYALHGVFQHVDDAVLARIPEVVAQGFPTLKAYTTYDGRLDDEGLLQVLAALRDAAACSPSIAKTTPSPVFWGTNCAAKRRAIP